jgi:HPt (histidine-containing phosphotransfer) domain-containing protein
MAMAGKYSPKTAKDMNSNILMLLESVTDYSGVFFSELPGLDVAAGLRHTGNDALFYVHILRRFRDGYANTAAEIRRLWATQGLEDAHRLAHSVKGLAGTIGAKELQQAAKCVESGFHTGELDPMTEQLATFETCLRVVTDGLGILGCPESDGDDNTGQKKQ